MARLCLDGLKIPQDLLKPLFFRNVPVTPTPSIFPKVLPHKMGGVLQYKWEAYCRVSLLRSLKARKVQRYKWGAYCRTNWRCTAVLFRQVVEVGVSETLPNFIVFYDFQRTPFCVLAPKMYLFFCETLFYIPSQKGHFATLAENSEPKPKYSTLSFAKQIA